MWHALLEGRSGVAPIAGFDASDLRTTFAAEVKGFDPAEHFERKMLRRLSRFAQFALVAAREAVTDAGVDFDGTDPYRVGVVIGTGIGGIQTLLDQAKVMEKKGPRRLSAFFIPMILPDIAAGEIAIAYGARGPNMSVISACATGTNAVGEATEMIRRGSADVMICGGTEAGIHPVAVAGFNVMHAISTRNDEPEKASRPFDATRDGFVMGEGSGVLILESLEHAQAREARIHAEVLGYGTTADAFHIAAPAEDGAGAAAAMSVALSDAAMVPEGIDYLNAHGTSTPLNDATETMAVKKALGDHAHRVAISSTKSMTGHLMGAAGAIEAIACVKALEDQTIPPTINYEHPDPRCDLDYVPNEARRADLGVVMSNSFGFGGHNACLILGRV
jgi:3-oxoacyl-[acyl-carrier-protein] synthase II